MLKKLILAVAGLAVSAPVLADREWRHERHEGYRHHRHFYGHQYHPRPVVVLPPRVYYAPPPVYYSPPVPHNGISVRLHFPL